MDTLGTKYAKWALSVDTLDIPRILTDAGFAGNLAKKLPQL